LILFFRRNRYLPVQPRSGAFASACAGNAEQPNIYITTPEHDNEEGEQLIPGADLSLLPLFQVCLSKGNCARQEHYFRTEIQCLIYTILVPSFYTFSFSLFAAHLNILIITDLGEASLLIISAANLKRDTSRFLVDSLRLIHPTSAY